MPQIMLPPFLVGFLEETADFVLPFEEHTAWLIAAVMVLLIIGSFIGKLLERSSSQTVGF